MLLLANGRQGAAVDAAKAGASSRTPRRDVERSDGSKAAAKLAVQAANDSLAEYQRMRFWIVWPDADFPRTPTGKPRLGVIAADARKILSGAQRDSESSGGPTGNLETLIGRFAAPHGESSPLENELNLSSLDRVELMSALEERYQVELSETAFAEAKTVGDVEHLLRRPGPSSRRPDYVYPRWTQRAPVRWLRLAVYYLLVWPATQILGHPRIVGRENLRGVRGPVLIVSNHITRRADIGLILAALPRRFRHRLATAMGGETLLQMRRPPRDWFWRSAGRINWAIGWLPLCSTFFRCRSIRAFAKVSVRRRIRRSRLQRAGFPRGRSERFRHGRDGRSSRAASACLPRICACRSYRCVSTACGK